MTAYPIAGYLHLVAGMGLFVALGLEWALLVRLRGAETVEQARSWLSLTAFQRPIGLGSLVTVLVAGVYMALASWGAVGWIVVTIAALVVMMGFGAYNGLRLAPLEQVLKNEHGALNDERRQQARNPLLLASVHGRAGLLLGVLLLMKFTPDLIGSIVAIAVAVVLGLVSAWPVLFTPQRQPRTLAAK